MTAELKNGQRLVEEADFLRSGFPAPREMPNGRADGPNRFFNREMSWLAFNWRVLEEAQNSHVPLLERVRFVAISATNLDEFYTVRVAGLSELARAGDQHAAVDGLLPSEQLREIAINASRLLTAQQETWELLKGELRREGIRLLDRDNLKDDDRRYLDDVFLDQVFPVLTPLAVDPAHPFPFIPNTGFALALRLSRQSDQRGLLALLPIPEQIDRFIRLDDSPSGKVRYIPLEELLLEKIGFIFPGYEVVETFAFRVLRDSDLEVEEEAEDLVREFETALKRRRRGEVIHLALTQGAPTKRAGRPQRAGQRQPARPAVAELRSTRARKGQGP